MNRLDENSLKLQENDVTPHSGISLLHWVVVAIVSLLLVAGCSDDREVGGSCQDDRDCVEQCLSHFPGGMCTLSCRGDSDCPSGTHCVDTEGGVCLFPCSSTADCEEQLGPEFACDDETTFDDREIWVCVD